MIDLHLHTNASDGADTPEQLVNAAAAKGIRILAVTDHDTLGGIAPARARAAALGIQVVPGIEITAVDNGRDVHILAYFLAGSERLERLLAGQRHTRVERAVEIATRLERMGAPIDLATLVATARSMSGKAIARPQIAQALCAAGHVASVAEAFERYLGESCAAYVPHTGISPREVVELVLQLGGVPSMAHPGYTNRDDLIPVLAAAGMPCLEVFHSAHDERETARYEQLAKSLDLVPTGGSDYHGTGCRRATFFGRVSLPESHFVRLASLGACSPASPV